VMLHEEVSLMSDADDDGDVDVTPSERRARLVEREIELAGARIEHAVRALDAEARGDVIGGHVGQATEGEQRVGSGVPIGTETLEREAPFGVERPFEHGEEITFDRRNVPDGYVKPGALG